MCGIVGFIHKSKYGFNAKDADAFETMLFLDTQRGWDSTGTFGVQNNGNMYMAKDAVHGADFIKTKEFTEIRHKMISSGQFWVGHNRWATRGSVTDKNAHPFVVDDNIILVQNGTMRGDHKKHKDVEVDTEAIAHVIHETGDIEEALNKIDASYALVWYNVKEKTLNLIRNNERPLYIAETKTGNIMFASEENMILYSAYKHELKLAGKPTLLPAHLLQQYKIDKDNGYEYEESIIKFKPPEVQSNTGNFTRFSHGYSHLEDDDDDADVFKRGPLIGAVREIVNKPAAPEKPSNVIALPQVIDRRDGPADVNIDFQSYIFARYPQFHLDNDQKNDCTRKLAIAAMACTPSIIQLEDYFHANNNDNCTTWFVFGRDIEPNNTQAIYYWIVFGKSEMELLNMCSDDIFYRVNPTNYQVRQAIINGEARYVVTRFCNERLVVSMDDHNVAHTVN